MAPEEAPFLGRKRLAKPLREQPVAAWGAMENPRFPGCRYATSALARAASSSWASASAQRGAALQALSRPLASGTAASAGTSSGGDGNSSSRWGFASGALALTGAAAAVGHSSLADTPSAPSTAPRWSGLSGDVTLYQYEVCPFCCKAKAALDYYGVPYKVHARHGSPPVCVRTGLFLGADRQPTDVAASSASTAGRGGQPRDQATAEKFGQ